MIEQIGELRGLIVCRSISDGQVDQLISYSNSDTEVGRFTSDPQRFKDRTAFKRWAEKGRVTYTLSDDADRLLGLIWFGAEPMPEADFIIPIDPTSYGFTYASRTYGDFIHQTLFLQTPLLGFWVKSSADNIPAMKLAEQLGYKVVSRPDHNNKVLLVAD